VTATTREALTVRFNLYGWPHLPLGAVADRVAHALAVPLRARTSPLRGVYYRWSGSGAADIVVQANVRDEDGVLVEPRYFANVSLVYATGLDEAGYEVLARIDGLQLLDGEVVIVDPSHSGASPTCRH
jgi:hypothetical protein